MRTNLLKAVVAGGVGAVLGQALAWTLRVSSFPRFSVWVPLAALANGLLVVGTIAAGRKLYSARWAVVPMIALLALGRTTFLIMGDLGTLRGVAPTYLFPEFVKSLCLYGFGALAVLLFESHADPAR